MDRDSVGIANALASKNHQIGLWNPDEHDIKEFEFDLAIFNDSSRLGFAVKKAVNKKKVLYLKTPPKDNIPGVAVETLPACADLERFPPAYYDKSIANEIFLYTYKQLTEEQLEILSLIPNSLQFKIVGVKVDLPNYIGNTTDPKVVTKLARSSKVCIDFDLMCAYDLAKIGCNVITDSENQVNLPVFNSENFLDTLNTAIQKKQPVLNPLDKLIMPYTQFINYLGEILEVEF